MKRKFIAYFYHSPDAWYHLSLGFHVDILSPNIEIHVPFGFIRIGWELSGRTYKVRRDGSYVGAHTIGIR